LRGEYPYAQALVGYCLLLTQALVGYCLLLTQALVGGVLDHILTLPAE